MGKKGGAEHFLKYFTDELIPFMDQSYRTQDFRILLGPQAGASFSIFALLKQPDLFKVHINTNPFWGRPVSEYLLTKAKDFFNSEDLLKSFLFVKYNPDDNNEDRMDYLNKLMSLAEGGKRKNFTMITSMQGENEINSRIPSPGLKEGLKAYFTDYKFPEIIEIEGLVDLKKYYQNISKQYGYEVEIPKFTLIRQGDKLQGKGKIEDAIQMYEYVVTHYPEDLNSYHRLAEIHERKGNYNQAIKYYDEFLKRRQEPFIQQRLNALKKLVK